MNVYRHLNYAPRIVLVALLAVVLMGVLAVSQAQAATAQITAAIISA